MNKFRNIIIALLILIIIPIVNSEETIKDVSVCDFFKNPFLGINKIPEICDSLDSMADYIGRFDLSSEEIENKYVDGVLDKKVYLSNKDFYIYYLYSGYKHQYLLQLVSISSNKNSIKYDIKIGMKKSEIISIFGNNYTINKFEENYEIVYEDNMPCSGAVQFSFNYNDVLGSINLWNVL